MPIVSDALHGGARRPVQAHFIFSGASMPDGDRTLSTGFEIIPQPPLIGSRPPVIGQDDVHDVSQISASAARLEHLLPQRLLHLWQIQ
jgi:hypothetical protein